jgi:hypothetical protein
MSSILISTRKGLFVADGERVVRGHFIGDNVTLATLDHGHFGVKLHRSDDRGATWTEIAAPAYPPQPEGSVEKKANGQPAKWATTLVWALAPALDRNGALWCGTLPGGLFRSDDRGASWQIVESLWSHPSRTKWMGGGADDPGIHSICVDPRDPRCVTIAVSCGGVWRTRDLGATWTNTATGMTAAYMPPAQAGDPDIQDPHLVVQCATRPTHWWSQHHCGIYRSTDDMASWTPIEHAGPSTFGFAVVVDPNDAETAWFIPGISDQKRIPVDGKLVVTRTRDGGKTFDVLDRGLPDAFVYDLVYRHAFAMGPDGTLAFGSTTGNAFASRDRGESWSAISHHLPPVHAVTFTL